MAKMRRLLAIAAMLALVAVLSLARSQGEPGNPKAGPVVRPVPVEERNLEKELAAIDYPVVSHQLRDDVISDFPGDPPDHLFLLGPAKPPRHPRASTMPGVEKMIG